MSKYEARDPIDKAYIAVRESLSMNRGDTEDTEAERKRLGSRLRPSGVPLNFSYRK